VDPQITITPVSKNFGSEEIGSCTSTYGFVLENVGGGTANGNVYLSGNDWQQFAITSGSGSFSLTSGQAKTIYVRFCPTSNGTKSATLYANGSSPCNDDYSNLTGVGIVPPPNSYVISGFIWDEGNNGISNVIVSFSNSGGTATTNGDGYYTKTVNEGYSGTVMPSKTDWSFSPTSKYYASVSSNYYNQNYIGNLLPPTINSPSYNASNINIPVYFDWSSVSSANAYRICVSTSSSGFDPLGNPMFPNSVVNQSGTGSFTSYSWSGAQPNTTYYWAVRVSVPGNTATTSVYTFTTQPSGGGCSPPTGLHEDNLTSISVKLDIPNTSGASRYNFRCYNEYNSLIVNDYKTSSYCYVYGLSSGSSYKWKVRVECNNDWTDYSEYSYFITLGGSSGPDLVVDNQIVNPVVIEAGEITRLDCTVKNMGNAATGLRSYVGYFLSTNTTYDNNDVFIDEDKVNDLDPGETDDEWENVTIPNNTTSGSYYMLFVADWEEDIAESSENNNVEYVQITVTPPYPDLIVQGPSANPTIIESGDNTHLECRIRNTGNGSTGSRSYVGYYLSINTTFDGDDIPLDDDYVQTLTSGDYNDEVQNVDIPSDISAGTYYILFVADHEYDVAEDDEYNNVNYVQITVTTPPSDLVVQNQSVTPLTFEAGDRPHLECTVKNIGSGTTGSSSRVGYYLSTNTTYDSYDVGLDDDGISILDPGETDDELDNPTIPDNTSAGIYYILFVADYEESITESNENNNTKYVQITVTEPPPDLIVETPTANPATIEAGLSTSLSSTVRNTGAGTTGTSSKEGYYLSTNTTYGAGDTYLGYSLVNTLDAGATSQETSIVTIPSNTSAGTYYILFFADYENTITESNESNNIGYVQIVVTEPPYLSVTPPNKYVGSNTNSTEFTLTTNTSWSASAYVGWLSLSPASGSSSTSLNVLVSENTIAEIRIGTITVVGASVPAVDVTVTQSAAPGIITISSPNGGESWEQSSTNDIIWSDNISEDVNIELYKNGSFNSIISSSTPSDGNFIWEIDDNQTPGDDYKIKITSTTNSSISQYSDNDFSITQRPIISMTPSFSTIDFGTQNEGSCSSTQDVTIQNVGGGIATGTIGLYLNSSHFQIVSGGGSYALSAGQIKTISVKFCPLYAGVFESWFLAVGDLPSNNDICYLEGICEQTMPWTEDWEGVTTTLYTSDDGLIDGTGEWAYDMVNEGGRLRFEAGADYYHGGSKAATLDRETNGDVNTNYLTATLNMLNYSTSTDIELSFWYMSHGEESHDNDRVWVRGSSSNTWLEIYNLYANQGSSGTWNHVENLDVDATLAAASPSQSFSSSFQIRFGQEDNYPSTSINSSDGYTFDDISLTEGSVPADLDVQNETIISGQNDCYNATNTITVAGSGTTVIINSGAEATFIAGEKILFETGFSAHQGSYVQAYITTTNEYCSQQQSMMANSIINEDGGTKALSDALDDTSDELVVNIYPNPTTGNFTIDFMGKETTADITVLNFQGNKIRSFECNNQVQAEVDISYLPVGMYIIIIKTETEIIKKKVTKLK